MISTTHTLSDPDPTLSWIDALSILHFEMNGLSLLWIPLIIISPPNLTLLLLSARVLILGDDWLFSPNESRVFATYFFVIVLFLVFIIVVSCRYVVSPPVSIILWWLGKKTMMMRIRADFEDNDGADNVFFEILYIPDPSDDYFFSNKLTQGDTIQSCSRQWSSMLNNKTAFKQFLWQFFLGNVVLEESCGK